MKILHIIDSGGLYGAEIMLLNLAHEQQCMGLRPCIASIGDRHLGKKAIEQRAEQMGISIQRFRMRPGPNWIGAVAILRYARHQGFDLLHSHGYKANILFGLLPACWRRLPIISTIHGYTSLFHRWSKMRLYEWLDSQVLPRMDAVVLVNRGMIDHPKLTSIKRERCHVIDNGIPELEELHNSIDESLDSFCDHPFVIGAIGRLSDEKGFHILVDAIARIIGDGRQAKLVLIGEGRRRRDLDRQVRSLGIGMHVLMTGFMDHAAACLPLFKVLTIPSLTEGLPITLLEAMRAGVPVVASRVGGIPHVITHNHSGLLTDPEDPKNLAEEILRLYDDDELHTRLAQNARQTFIEKYTCGLMASRYQQLYQQLLDARKY
jgi:glycosyltransferase involved in cell wall biosynthesis